MRGVYLGEEKNMGEDTLPAKGRIVMQTHPIRMFLAPSLTGLIYLLILDSEELIN
jgi:hypothetical protein